MPNENLCPYLVTCKASIDGFCKEGQWKEATKVPHDKLLLFIIFGELLDVMVQICNQPNADTYNTSINGFCKVVNLEKAGALLQEIPERGCSPHLVISNTSVNGFYKPCRIDEVQHLEMPNQSLNSDVVAYSTLMCGLCKVGNLKVTIKLYKQLKASSHVPDVIKYSTLTDGL